MQFVASAKAIADARDFVGTKNPVSNAKPISLHASLHHTCTRLLVTVATALLLERRARFAAGFATAAGVKHGKGKNGMNRAQEKQMKLANDQPSIANIDSNDHVEHTQDN